MCIKIFNCLHQFCAADMQLFFLGGKFVCAILKKLTLIDSLILKVCLVHLIWIELSIFRDLFCVLMGCCCFSQGVNATENRMVSTTIPLSEVPFVMRALGFYPSEQEVQAPGWECFDGLLNQIKSIFIIQQYTKHKNEICSLTHGLKKLHLK